MARTHSILLGHQEDVHTDPQDPPALPGVAEIFQVWPARCYQGYGHLLPS